MPLACKKLSANVSPKSCPFSASTSPTAATGRKLSVPSWWECVGAVPHGGLCRARVLQNTVLILWSQSRVFYPNTTAHVLVNCRSRQLFIRRGKEVEICVSLPRSASSGGRSMRRCKDRGGDSPAKQGLGPTGLHKLSLSQRGDLTATL